MADIFISYAREDRERCVEIRNALAALNLSVWFDAELLSGEPFRDEIDRELEAARVVLVLWSSRSVKSDFVHDEVQAGQDRDILAAAFIEDCKPPVGQRGRQAPFLAVGVAGTLDDGWLNLLRRIGDLIGRPGLRSYTRTRMAPSVAGWTRWISEHPSDPLIAQALSNAIALETRKLRDALADERTTRLQLEAGLEDEQASGRSQIDRIRKLTHELAAEKRAHDHTRHVLEQAKSELGHPDLSAELASRDARIAELEASLDDGERTRQEERDTAREVEVRASESVARLTEELAAREKYIAHLESASGDLEELLRRERADRSSTDQQVHVQDKRLKELEASSEIAQRVERDGRATIARLETDAEAREARMAQLEAAMKNEKDGRQFERRLAQDIEHDAREMIARLKSEVSARDARIGELERAKEHDSSNRWLAGLQQDADPGAALRSLASTAPVPKHPLVIGPHRPAAPAPGITSWKGADATSRKREVSTDSTASTESAASAALRRALALRQRRDG